MGSRTVAAIIALLAITVPAVGAPRELRHRSITVNDANRDSVPELHVAPGLATVLAFEANVRDATFVRPVGALFQKVTRTDRIVVLVPKQVVPKPVSLSVVMADGTIITFALVTVPSEVDAQVDVTIDLHAAPDSPVALNAQIAALRAQLDQCQGTSDAAAARKIASLILTQGLDSPQAFETHPMSGGDRQSRLLIQAKRLYRLLGLTYVVLSVDNRDPSRNWVLAHPVVHLTGGDQEMELSVVAFVTDQQELPPDNEEKVVVAFKTPQSVHPDQRISIALVEKDGMRRVELTGLEL